MFSRLSRALILTGLLVAVPSGSLAQRHGGGGHGGGGGWHGNGGHGGGGWNGGGRHGGGYRYGGGYGHGGHGHGYGGRYGYGGYGGYWPYYGYGAYGGYPAYYGYGGYPGYYGYGHYENGAWIAVGAGILGAVVGAAIAHPHDNYYAYPGEAPPQAVPAPVAPAVQRCPDGSVIPQGNYCMEAQPVAPPPPMNERG